MIKKKKNCCIDCLRATEFSAYFGGARTISMLETLLLCPFSPSSTSVLSVMPLYSVPFKNLFLKISHTSTAWEMALPRAFTVQSSPLLRIIIVAIT